MGVLREPFRLAAGDGQACYYPAHVSIKDRHAPGAWFELAPGRSWRWVGHGGPLEVELVDVLAAAALERLAGREVARRPILQAHALALVGALRAGQAELAERLGLEQAAALDTVDEWELGGLAQPPLRHRTIRNYKLNAPRRVPPPVQLAGSRQSLWLWSRAQAAAWIGARPGVAWRAGLSDADIAASGRRLPGRPRRTGRTGRTGRSGDAPGGTVTGSA
jgi:hypothetical protein